MKLDSHMRFSAIAVSVVAAAVAATLAGSLPAGAETHGYTTSKPHETYRLVFPVGVKANPADCDNVGSIYEANINQNVTFCGLGYYYRPKGGWQVTIVQPLTDNRWWFHGSGYSWCTDYTHETLPGTIPILSPHQDPDNIQVVSNTDTC